MHFLRSFQEVILALSLRLVMQGKQESLWSRFLRWSHFLGQPAKVGSLMRMTDHEDAETIFV